MSANGLFGSRDEAMRAGMMMTGFRAGLMAVDRGSRDGAPATGRESTVTARDTIRVAIVAKAVLAGPALTPDIDTDAGSG